MFLSSGALTIISPVYKIPTRMPFPDLQMPTSEGKRNEMSASVRRSAWAGFWVGAFRPMRSSTLPR